MYKELVKCCKSSTSVFGFRNFSKDSSALIRQGIFRQFDSYLLKNWSDLVRKCYHGCIYERRSPNCILQVIRIRNPDGDRGLALAEVRALRV